MTKMVMGDEHDHVADDVGADDDDDDDDDGDDGDPGTLSRCSGQSRGKCSAGRGKRWQGEAKREEVVDRTSRQTPVPLSTYARAELRCSPAWWHLTRQRQCL